MDLVQALILGILQGLTEFLPISSSAHLIIVPALLGWRTPGLAFDLALHLGTLVAVISYFWRDLLGMALALPRGLASGRPLADPDSRLALLLMAGGVPAGITGLLFESVIQDVFHTEAGLRQGLMVIAIAMIALALLLWMAERRADHRREIKDVTLWDALFVGVAQALALAPGVSRSGATMTAGLFAGLSRPAAARFSFLLGTPIILAAGLKETATILRDGLPGGEGLPFLIGFLASAIVGYLCITVLLRFLQTRTMAIFIVYRIVFGVSLLVFSLLR